MADLLRFLDDEGRHGAISARHHGRPRNLPARWKRRVPAELDAKRVPTRPTSRGTLTTTSPRSSGRRAAMRRRRPRGWRPMSFPWVYFNARVLAAAGKTREEAAKVTAEFLRSHPDIGRAFTRADLAGQPPANDAIATRVRRSFHPDRSGDVYVVLKEWYLPYGGRWARERRTARRYDYDTHVPLMLLAPTLGGGEGRSRQLRKRWRRSSPNGSALADPTRPSSRSPRHSPRGDRILHGWRIAPTLNPWRNRSTGSPSNFPGCGSGWVEPLLSAPGERAVRRRRDRVARRDDAGRSRAPTRRGSPSAVLPLPLRQLDRQFRRPVAAAGNFSLCSRNARLTDAA